MKLAKLEEIIERIENELHICEEALATLQPILLDPQVVKKFNNNYSAHVVNYLQTALHRDALMAIARMWDNGDDAWSIRRVMRELKNDGVIDEIKAARRKAKLAILDSSPSPEYREAITRLAYKQAEDAAGAVDHVITEIKALCDDPDFCKKLDSHMNWRHKHIAHTLETTRMEREATKTGVVIFDPKWGELFDLKAHTNRVVALLRLLITDTSIFPEESERIFARYADAFWGSIKEKPE